MIQKFIKDVFATSFAFIFIHLLNLVLISFFVNFYGLTLYGLIILSRIFLPSGSLGILDPGISEITTIEISSARASNELIKTGSKLTFLFFLSFIIGIFVSIILFGTLNHLGSFLNIPIEYQLDFENTICFAAIFSPLFFVGSFFEGIIKGYEKFLILRIVEILCSLFYVFMSLISIYLSKSFVWPIYLYFISQIIKIIIITFISLSLLYTDKIFLKIEYNSLKILLSRGKQLFYSKIISSFQNQLPTILIASVLGPSALAIYDVVLKIPRFLKGFLAMIASSVIIPSGSKLFSLGEEDKLKNIGIFIITILPVIIIPPLFVISIFSKNIIAFWLGQSELLIYSIWLSLALIIPLINTLSNYQSSILLSKQKYLKKNNLIIFFQTLFQLFLSIILIEYLNEFSFVFAQAIMTIIFYFFQVRLVAKFLKIPKNFIIRIYILLLGSISLSIIFISIIGDYIFSNIYLLCLIMITSLLILWAIYYIFFLHKDEKKHFYDILQIIKKLFFPERTNY